MKHQLTHNVHLELQRGPVLDVDDRIVDVEGGGGGQQLGGRGPGNPIGIIYDQRVSGGHVIAERPRPQPLVVAQHEARGIAPRGVHNCHGDSITEIRRCWWWWSVDGQILRPLPTFEGPDFLAFVQGVHQVVNVSQTAGIHGLRVSEGEDLGE